MPSFTDTIAALATPVGTSAIAVVRVSGPISLPLTRDLFKETPPPRMARRGDYFDAGGQLVDDVLFTFFAAPNSFTGEDSLEISCHGNPFIAQKISEDLFLRGCRPADPGEFSKRAFLNGKMDLSQAEAVMDLIQARSDRALAAANQQLRGFLGRKMDELISLLIRILAQIEAHIDFPEEDLPPDDKQGVLTDLAVLMDRTGRLLATSHYGELLRGGIKTIIVGEPNAGKSSLLNQLVGRERALVSPEPGTTRDYIEECIAVGPDSLRLIDTAGLNSSPSSLEKRGIDKTLEQATGADLFIWVLDLTRPVPALPATLQARMTAKNTVVAYNKADLHSASVHGGPLLGSFPQVRISALCGTGIEQLMSLLATCAESFRVDLGEDLIAINARHACALEEARRCLAGVRDKMINANAIEFVASDLRTVLDLFGEISGKIDNEQILDKLFASFCIGK